ncbi:MAG: acyl transferase [Elusimicrobia bacterium]|nr:acyl transferase [Elusimicrobiota bacterium]
MTLKSYMAMLFPAILLATIGFSAVKLSVLGTLSAVYLLPVLVYRCFVVLYPLELGLSNMAEKKFSPWWASHQIQLLYTAVPVLEAVLRMIPGAYSAWLRLWGSRIGSSVYWTPRMEIHDRGLLNIGDNVIFGHKVELYGHTVTPKRSRLLLYTGLVTVGSGAFVGAGSRLAPGVVIEPGAVVPILTDLYMNARFPMTKEELDAPRPA